MKKKREIRIFKCYYSSPIGLLRLQGRGSKLISVSFVENKTEAENLNVVLEKTMTQLKEYFSGDRLKFDLDFELEGTDFQIKVWKMLTMIDYGETVSYKKIAEKIKNPKAYRAVGNANNKNKLPIIVPCHRVVGSKGQLTGYAGGLWRKKWLLDHEVKRLERK